MKGLILCHGNNYEIGNCNTSGLTKEVLQKYDTLDKMQEANPHIVHDLTKPIKTIDKKYDVITTLCCPGDILLDAKDQLSIVFFSNIHHLLQTNGYFILELTGQSMLKPLQKLSESRTLKSYWKQISANRVWNINAYKQLYSKIEKEQTRLLPLFIKNCILSGHIGNLFTPLGRKTKYAFLRRINNAATNNPLWKSLIVLRKNASH